MLLIVILSWWVCFSPRRMALFHRHCFFCYFIDFLCFLISHEFDHSLGSLITLAVLFWAIIISLYIITVFLWSQWHRFTVTVVDFIFWSFSVTHPHGWVQPLVGLADYIDSTFLSDHIISIYHHIFLPEQWRCFTATVDDCYIYIFYYSYPWMTTTTCWYCWLN